MGSSAVEFVSYRQANRPFPCIAYAGGGSCFVGVGSHCGLALNVNNVDVDGRAFAVGAAVPQAASIRFGHTMTIPSGAIVRSLGVRMFAALLPPSAVRVPPDDVVALNRRGRLLGRQHFNDGHGGFGAMDGLIDKGCAKRPDRPRHDAPIPGHPG